MKIGLLFAALALIVQPVFAQTIRTLDLRARPESLAESVERGPVSAWPAKRAGAALKSSYFVVLASRRRSATGHAFVVWGVEDARRHRTTVRALGLYPEGSGANCSSLVRTVRGSLFDELQTHSFQGIDQELILRVDEADYLRSLQVAREWDCRHEFSLFSRDCVEFLRAVGLSLGLDMPIRGVTRWTPPAYVRAVLEKADDGLLVNKPASTDGEELVPQRGLELRR